MIKDLSPEQIEDVLNHQMFGHLGCCGEDRPYVIPMAFVYVNNMMYAQTGEGMKVDLMRKNTNVCMNVSDKNDIQNWRSVNCWGTFEELDFDNIKEQPDVINAIKTLSDRLGATQKSIGVNVDFLFNENPFPLQQEGRKATFFRIVINEKTGKYFDPES